MKWLIWDFDGTLAYRLGKWSGAFLDVLQREMPGYSATRQHVRPHLSGGFPWHHPDVTRPPNEPPDAWWDRLYPVLARAYKNVVEMDEAKAYAMARLVREAYTDTANTDNALLTRNIFAFRAIRQLLFGLSEGA